MPVASVNSLLFFGLRVSHVDTVVDTRSVADKERRSVVAFRFRDSVEELLFVRTHSALSNVNVAIAHSHHAEVLLLNSLTARSEFSNRTRRSGLTSLSACVGVNFGVYDENVDVFALSENVVESAIADIVSPAVAADNPDRFLDYAIEHSAEFFKEILKFALSVLNSRGKSCFENVVNVFRNFCALLVFKPELASLADSSVKVEFENLSHNVCKFFSSLEVSKVEAEAVFRVVFEQAVSPCRTSSFFVLGVRTCRGRTAVNGRTTRSVCDDHTVAEHLSDNLDVRSFAAACACARELEEGFRELRTFNGVLLEYRSIDFGKIFAEFVVFGFFFNNFFKRNHCKSLLVFLSGADVSANAATHTVKRAYLHSVRISFKTDCRFRSKRCRNFRAVFNENRADTSVRADERALVTLNTIFCVPSGDLNRNASLFESRSSGGNASVCIECRGGKLVALERDNRMNNFLEVFIVRKFSGFCASSCVSPACGNFDFFKFGSSLIDCRIVHVDNRVAFLPVRFLNVLLHPVFRFSVRHDFGVDLEECSLHDRVRSSAETDGSSDLDSVDDVKFSVLFSK